MRSIRYHDYGNPDVLTVEEVPVPSPGPGQVLIRSEAIGVNFVETQRRRGTGPFPPPLPATPNGDVVGRVEQVGAEVTTVAVGDRVAAPVMGGAYADFVLADATFLAPLPDGIDTAQASILASPAQTALCVLKTARIRPGDTVLVHAAAGAIGHLMTQLVRHYGAGRVIGTVGSPAKAAFAREHGTDIVVDYSTQGWTDDVLKATDGEGADVILDSVGGDILLAGLDVLKPFGRLVFYGAAGGTLPQVPAMRLIPMKHVVGCGLDQWWQHRPDDIRTGLQELIGHVTEGRLKVHVHAELPLTEAAAAHRIIEDRAQLGRILLRP
ncbi:quinone oxidoreductase family protein [Streptomyces sp. enrichment culture]|uniref:quinone oxidoreductase family protein n=1 Tax=Streptomyces sp. enrichment culture TaxID=1795815 RepID=UPI003F54A0F5